MLGSHFHDQIVRQALISPLIILVGIVVVVAALDRRRADSRIARRLLIGVGLVVAAAGLYRLVEVPALSHNHLCHGHHADTCGSDHDSEGHTHWYWFGGRTAEPRSPRDRVPYSPPPMHHTCTTALPRPSAPVTAQTTGPPSFPGCPPGAGAVRPG